VIDQIRQLVQRPHQASLFDVLGELVRSGHADARETLQLALDTIPTNPSGQAGELLVDLRAHLRSGDLSRPVLRSLVLMAGTPELHGLALAFSVGRSRDARGLMVAIEVALPGLLDTLAEMLGAGSAGNDQAPILLLPPGVGSRAPTQEEHQRDTERASAAVAARRVLTEVPGAAGVFAQQLLSAFNVPDAEDYGVSPTYEITETLARLVLEQPGLVVPLLVQAGESASGNVRERLMDVAERATRRLRFVKRKVTDGDVGYIDEVGDYPEHRLGPVDLPVVVQTLFNFALDRLGGDWGQRVGGDAGRMLSELVRDHPDELMSGGKGVYAVIGHLLDESRRGSVGHQTLAAPSPLREFERIAARQNHASLMRELRKALAAFANVNVDAVLDRVEPLLDAPIPATGSPQIADQLNSPPQPGNAQRAAMPPDALADREVRLQLRCSALFNVTLSSMRGETHRTPDGGRLLRTPTTLLTSLDKP
jgi:hypothetical protein